MDPWLHAFFRRRWEFERGDVGRSVRRLPLHLLAAPDVRVRLLRAGFGEMRRPLAGERGPSGEAQWVCRDGVSTDDPSHPQIVDTWVFAHEDGGLVEVFPRGDPRGGEGPRRPFARKLVLFVPLGLPLAAPQAIERGLAGSNRAFVVTEADDAIASSRRASRGGFFDPAALLDSYLLNEQVMRAGTIELSSEEWEYP